MNKKARGKAETLLFIFGISFAVFILLFIIIAIVVMIWKNPRKGGTLFSFLRTAAEQAPGSSNDTFQSETESVEPANRENRNTNTETNGDTVYVHAKGDLH
jgi:flagellar basal body-associated protein FliL